MISSRTVRGLVQVSFVFVQATLPIESALHIPLFSAEQTNIKSSRKLTARG